VARIRSAAVHEGPLERAIHRFKYRGRAALARPLARLVAERLAIEGLPADAIGWVPLHVRRLRERGYDQAQLIAVEVSHLTCVPLLRGSLRRIRQTPPQVGLDRLHRQENVAGAFVYAGAPAVGPVVLIDDVATTGATLDAAAVALRRAGISPVFGFTVARATV
jgi:ComF family protein